MSVNVDPASRNTPRSQKLGTGRAHSFPKAERKLDNEGSGINSNTDDVKQVIIIDVDKSKKYLEPNCATATMKPHSIAVAAQETDLPPPPVVPMLSVNIDVLSNKPRPPAAVMMKPSEKSKKVINFELEHDIVQGSLGPGYYNVEDAYESTSKGKRKANSINNGKVYHDSSTSTNINAKLRQIDGTPSALGPYTYDLTHADKYLKHQQKSNVCMKADDKVTTKQLLKKKYWDDKAYDLRQAHDGMLDATDTYIKPKAKSVTISSKSVAETIGNWKTKKIINDRRKSDSSRSTYNIKYSIIDKKSSLLVNMQSQLKAKESIQHEILSKPSIAKVFYDKIEAEKARDKFYGPMLPIQWVSDSRGETRGGDEMSDDGIIDDVMDMLNRNANATGSGGGSGGISKHNVTSVDAERYMNSSYSGIKITKPSVSMKNTISRDAVAAAAGGSSESNDFDFLSTQLPVDWLQSKSATVRLDVNSRDQVKVYTKGIQQVIKFTDHLKKDDVSITAVTTSVGNTIGNDVKGVPFSKGIARDDQSGPFGEPPQRAASHAMSDMLDDYFVQAPMRNADGMTLDIDYADAKDKYTMKKESRNHMLLYTNERYTADATSSDASTGGSDTGGLTNDAYFKLVDSKVPVVAFDKMTGRSGNTNSDSDDVDAMNSIYRDMNVVNRADYKLDIYDVIDTTKVKAAADVAMADPVKYPRFADHPVDAKERQLRNNRPTLSPKHSCLDTPPVYPVDMSKQLGRSDTATGTTATADILQQKELVNSLLGLGNIDRDMAIEIESDRQKLVDAAMMNVAGKHARVSDKLLDMSLQSGRDTGNTDAAAAQTDTHVDVVYTEPKIKGTVEWSKVSHQKGRLDISTDDIIRSDAVLNELLHVPQVVIDIDAVTASKTKKPTSGPQWLQKKHTVRRKDGSNKDKSSSEAVATDALVIEVDDAFDSSKAFDIMTPLAITAPAMNPLRRSVSGKTEAELLDELDSKLKRIDL